MSYENNNKSRCIVGTSRCVHNFLYDPDDILRVKLEGKGRASFKVIDTSWYVGVGDYILCISEDKSHKVIYRIIEVDTSREIKVGMMEDLCILDKIDKEATAAIKLMDPIALAKEQERNHAHVL